MKAASCNFCGHPRVHARGSTAAIAVVCSNRECGARGPVRSTLEEAVDAWNATVSRAGPDAFEHWTCGTAHMRAERTLRLIDKVSASQLDAIEMIHSLVDEAGIANARAALEWGDVPF